MEKTMKKAEFVIGNHFMIAMVNGDTENFTMDEEQQLESFKERLNELSDGKHFTMEYKSVGFDKCEISGLYGDCSLAIMHIIPSWDKNPKRIVSDLILNEIDNELNLPGSYGYSQSTEEDYFQMSYEYPIYDEFGYLEQYTTVYFCANMKEKIFELSVPFGQFQDDRDYEDFVDQIHEAVDFNKIKKILDKR